MRLCSYFGSIRIPILYSGFAVIIIRFLYSSLIVIFQYFRVIFRLNVFLILVSCFGQLSLAD